VNLLVNQKCLYGDILKSPGESPGSFLEILQEILLAKSPGGPFGGPDTVSVAKTDPAKVLGFRK